MSEPEVISKPRVILIGEDGHSFDVLVRCKRAAKEAGWTAERISAFHAEATRSDYDNLFAVVLMHFDVE